MFRKYTLKQPANRHARIGAFYAALPPVIIGMVLFIDIAGRGADASHPAMVPMALTMVFGAPLVAMISQIFITRRQKLDYWSIVEVALICATIVQLGFSALYLFYYTLTTPDLVVFTNLLSTCVAINAILWVTATLPLTLICAAVFRRSAMRPIYG